MKVYILLQRWNWDDDGETIGVFDSFDKADTRMTELVRKDKMQGPDYEVVEKELE